jgi:hypothetical protein
MCEESTLATTGFRQRFANLITIWSFAVDDGQKYTELTLQVGESIRVGDAIISIIETQDNQAAVLVEELSFVDEFGSEAPLSASQPL